MQCDRPAILAALSRLDSNGCTDGYTLEKVNPDRGIDLDATLV